MVLTQEDRKPMTYGSFTKSIKELNTAAKLMPQKMGSHSLRLALTTTLTKQKAQ